MYHTLYPIHISNECVVESVWLSRETETQGVGPLCYVWGVFIKWRSTAVLINCMFSKLKKPRPTTSGCVEEVKDRAKTTEAAGHVIEDQQ